MSPQPFSHISRARFRSLGALIALGLVGSAAAQPNGLPPSAPAPVIVDRPLAPPATDTPEEQVSPLHVWVPGHWRWGQGSYVWVVGRWQLPPVAYASWVAPQWEQQGNGYVLREGYWQQNPPPPTPNATAEIATAQPPPLTRPEPIPEQPSPLHVWIPGYWNWRDNQFGWIPGRWEVPPRAGLTWVPAHWETRGDRYVLVAGYWRDTGAAPQVTPPAPVVVTPPTPAPQVVVVQPPPPPQQEVVYVRPSPGHVWVPGYWAWRGDRYVWMAGHWTRPPRGRQSWVEPRWERRGGNYVFIEGHWR